MTLIQAARQILSRTREKLDGLPRRSRHKLVYILYHERMIRLISTALELLGREEGVSAESEILIRSALECVVDMTNLSMSEHYLLVLRAIALENRYDIFRYKTQPLYDMLISEQGGEGINRMGKSLLEEFRLCLKEASRHYPSINSNPRNLSVVARFRMANKKHQYHTMYTWLSMQSHNDLEPIFLQSGIVSTEDRVMFQSQVATQDAAVIHIALELLMDGVHCIHRLFGPDDNFVKDIIHILESVTGKDSEGEG